LRRGRGVCKNSPLEDGAKKRKEGTLGKARIPSSHQGTSFAERRRKGGDKTSLYARQHKKKMRKRNGKKKLASKEENFGDPIKMV